MTPPSFSVYGIATPLIYPGDDVAERLLESVGWSGAGEFKTGDVLAVAESALATAEGRVVSLASVEPSEEALRLARDYVMDARLAEVVLRESDREDQLIRSIIQGCDPAVGMQLPAVVELSWPLSGPMKVTSPYGERLHPIIGEEAFHRGVDLRARYGSPILAPADGIVLYTGTKTEYGNMLVVLHGEGIATVYGHLWKFAVHPYERVTKGQLLGYTGNTGFSTGPHLHFEVRQNGEPTNPLKWVPPIETTGERAVSQ